MKKILLSLLLGALCNVSQVNAGGGDSDGENENNKQAEIPVTTTFSAQAVLVEEAPTASVSAFTRIPVAGGSFMILLNGQLYQEQSKSIWSHVYEENISVKNFGTFIEVNGEKIITSEPTAEYFPHVDERPKDDLTSVLWKKNETSERVLQHHITGGKVFSQWEFKGSFQIFKYRYQQTVTHLLGLVDGTETILDTRVVSRDLSQVGQILGKKGKDTWSTDPQGQGSHGIYPQTEADKQAKFKELFGI